MCCHVCNDNEVGHNGHLRQGTEICQVPQNGEAVFAQQGGIIGCGLTMKVLQGFYNAASISVDKFYSDSQHPFSGSECKYRDTHKRQKSQWYLLSSGVHVGNSDTLSICCFIQQLSTSLVHHLWIGSSFQNLTILLKGKVQESDVSPRRQTREGGRGRDLLWGHTHSCLCAVVIQKLLLSRRNK